MALAERPDLGGLAVLTTKHGKERVIAPLLQAALGVPVVLAPGVDTDRFGTFSREVERTGTQLDAARAKIAAGFEAEPGASFGVASEGSFGPHPHIPFLALGRELILLVERETGREWIGYDASPQTNYGQAMVRDLAAALAFANRARFPEHGLIVTGLVGDQPSPGVFLRKDLVMPEALEEAVVVALDRCGGAMVETDMRAHRNPTRMAAIARATSDLGRRYTSLCPTCSARGYDVTERLPGLPCSDCGAPTRVIRSEVLTCAACGHTEERPVPTSAYADPGVCDYCNP